VGLHLVSERPDGPSLYMTFERMEP